MSCGIYKTATNYDGDLLLAPYLMRTLIVIELLENGKRIDIDTPGHDIHYDKPKEFIEIMIDFWMKFNNDNEKFYYFIQRLLLAGREITL